MALSLSLSICLALSPSLVAVGRLDSTFHLHGNTYTKEQQVSDQACSPPPCAWGGLRLSPLTEGHWHQKSLDAEAIPSWLRLEIQAAGDETSAAAVWNGRDYRSVALLVAGMWGSAVPQVIRRMAIPTHSCMNWGSVNLPPSISILPAC